ncbi:YpmS family protein [Lacticaseibacillus brantae]|uniref:YpmS family protein n=1 Tax=Lacticaseibacillus brantae TaxID=943673 RepID=UPI001F2DBC39|nr:YpmS family protein [Lacticaseibacillus brantae]
MNRLKRRFNWWLVATLVLLGLIIGSGAWFISKVTSPIETPESTVAARTDEPVFHVNLTKAQVNRLVSYYLADYLKDSPIKYQLVVGDSAVLSGNFKFLGAKVGFNLEFDPYVLNNGDVQLKARKLNVGSLPVPTSFVLNYVGHSYKLPKWVGLSEKNETVTLHLSQYQLANDMQLRAQKIDLIGDSIQFGIYLPKSNKE